MMEAIADFAARKKADAKRRLKHGTLTARERYEEDHPYGSEEQLKAKVQKLRVPTPDTQADVPYDIYNCPGEPPEGYPYAWNVRRVLENWDPDNTDMPASIHQGLCVFDWNSDYQKAETYRKREVPFVIQNAPEVMKASLRWMSDGYLDDLLGDELIRNEHSQNNQFMYWKTVHPRPDYKPPTEMITMTYADWHRHALELDRMSSEEQVSQEHWYFRLNGSFENHHELYEELPFFDPSLGTSMTMIDPAQHRGINCRYGQRGITAEAHFDSSSNFIALMGGQRR